jgi:hypothetical protein
MREKRYRFSANLEVSIIQKDDERFKSKKMNKDHEERKQFFFWLTKSEHSSILLKIDEYFATNELQDQKKRTRRDSALQNALSDSKI